MNTQSSGYNWDMFSEEVKANLTEKKLYERRLGELLEDIRQAALGIDYQTKVHLKMVEKRVIKKLIETRSDIDAVIKKAIAEAKLVEMQGSLFDE